MNWVDEFGIPQSTITNLVRKGIIASGVINKYQMYAFYKSKLESGVVNAEAVKLTSEQFEVSKTYVYKIIQQFS